ncbi:MAG: sialidase family protein [Phototrophicaceae bacterium]
MHKLLIIVVTLAGFILFSLQAFAQQTGECLAGDANHESPLASHRVMVIAKSDGSFFDRQQAQIALEQASVPDGVLTDEGVLRIYFVNGVAGQHGVFVMEQQTDGSFSVLDCIKVDGVFEGNAVDPDITRMDDGRYRLFYFLGTFVGNGRKLGPNDPHPIYSAVSDDGINFELEGKVFSTTGITDPTAVQFADGSWLLAMARAGQEIVLAHSQDGMTFSELAPVADGGIPELTLFDGETVRLYGRNIWESHDKGQTWEQLQNVGNLNPDPSLVRRADGGWIAIYKDFDPNNMPVLQPPVGGGTPPAPGKGQQPPLLPSLTPAPSK